MELCKGKANVSHLPDAHFTTSSPKPPMTTWSCFHPLICQLTPCLSQLPLLAAATPMGASGVRQSYGKGEDAGTSCHSWLLMRQQHHGSFVPRDPCLPLLRDIGIEARNVRGHKLSGNSPLLRTKKQIHMVLWFSLNACGLNLGQRVPAWRDGIPKKGTMSRCLPPAAPQGAFHPVLIQLFCCVVMFPGPVRREHPWVVHAAVQRHRHCSPFSLAGRGEGCHYFTNELGKSSMFAVSNASNMIIAGLSLEFANIRQLRFWPKTPQNSSGQVPRPPSPANPSYSHQDSEYSRLVLGLLSSTWH